MSKILSQEEIDSLLRGLGNGEIKAVAGGFEDAPGIVPFDPAGRDRNAAGMPVLELFGDRFARLASTALADSTHRQVHVRPASVDISGFGEFMGAVPAPANINILRVEPLPGNAVLVLDTRLVFALVEKCFGGAGVQLEIKGRELTPIEQSVIGRVIGTLLSCLEQAWSEVHEVRIELLRMENNPRLTGIVPVRETAVVLSMDVDLEGAGGSLFLCLPTSTLEPIRFKVFASFPPSWRTGDEDAWISGFKQRLLEVPVELAVRLGSTSVTGRQLLNMDAGEVLFLDTGVKSPLRLAIQGVDKFFCRPGLLKANRAVQILREAEAGT